MFLNFYFPTIISSDTNVPLANSMLPVAKKYLNDNSMRSDAWGYKNTYGKGIEQLPDVKPFVDYIREKSVEYFDSCGYDSQKISFKIEVFTSEMFEGDSHDRHAHANSLLSGVFYLQAPKGSSSIKFFDPRPHKNCIAYPIKDSSPNNWDELYVPAEVGVFLIWESWLQHSVPINHSKDGRITLVFNVSSN